VLRRRNKLREEREEESFEGYQLVWL